MRHRRLGLSIAASNTVRAILRGPRDTWLHIAIGEIDGTAHRL
ncbi:MAG TPA: hypothetical protein VFZ98_03375 [Vicinamibacterales bacterium]